MALANRARNNPAGGAGGARQVLGGGGDAGGGNRGMLLRRSLEARQNCGGGGQSDQPDQYAQQLSELQSRVNQLTEEVERLRASQAANQSASPHGSTDSGG